jgi:hypothetical protein
MSVLQDPVHQLLGFAGLIEQAGLTAELATAEAEQTLFVPSNEVSISSGSWHAVGGSCGQCCLCDGVTFAVWCGILASKRLPCGVYLCCSARLTASACIATHLQRHSSFIDMGVWSAPHDMLVLQCKNKRDNILYGGRMLMLLVLLLPTCRLCVPSYHT